MANSSNPGGLQIRKINRAVFVQREVFQLNNAQLKFMFGNPSVGDQILQKGIHQNRQ
jgi:hypothetical protein